MRCNSGNDSSKCTYCVNNLYLSGDKEGNCVIKENCFKDYNRYSSEKQFNTAEFGNQCVQKCIDRTGVNKDDNSC